MEAPHWSKNYSAWQYVKNLISTYVFVPAAPTLQALWLAPAHPVRDMEAPHWSKKLFSITICEKFNKHTCFFLDVVDRRLWEMVITQLYAWFRRVWNSIDSIFSEDFLRVTQLEKNSIGAKMLVLIRWQSLLAYRLPLPAFSPHLPQMGRVP